MTTIMPEAARAELAPGGRLRAGLNYSNDLLVKARAPEHVGVAPDLARELARRAGATVAFVGFDNAGLVADAVRDDAWDVAFIGAEPARADAIAFTRAYVEIACSYLVRAESSIHAIEDVDRPGIRIATAARAAYTLYLQRTLQHAALVEAVGIGGSVELFAGGSCDALAGLLPRLTADATRLPGTRLLDGRFTSVQQSMGVATPRSAAAEYLERFVEEIKASGLLAELIARHDARGLTVAATVPGHP